MPSAGQTGCRRNHHRREEFRATAAYAVRLNEIINSGTETSSARQTTYHNEMPQAHANRHRRRWWQADRSVEACTREGCVGTVVHHERELAESAMFEEDKQPAEG